jgi:hypothetical protein
LFFFQHILLSMCIYTIVAISLERCQAICHPLRLVIFICCCFLWSFICFCLFVIFTFVFVCLFLICSFVFLFFLFLCEFFLYLVSKFLCVKNETFIHNKNGLLWFLSFFLFLPSFPYIFVSLIFSFSYFIVSNIKLACLSKKYHFLVLTTDR